MSENGGQNVIICPNCGSSGVKKGGNVFIIGGMIAVLAGLFIPVIGWFVMIPVGIIFAFIGWIRERNSEVVKIQCTNCKHLFDVNSDVYNKYKEEMN